MTFEYFQHLNIVTEIFGILIFFGVNVKNGILISHQAAMSVNPHVCMRTLGQLQRGALVSP